MIDCRSRKELERQGIPFRVVQDHRGKDVRIPGADEIGDPNRGDGRQSQGQVDLGINAPFVAPIDEGGISQFTRDGAEIAAEEKDGKRAAAIDHREDQAHVGGKLGRVPADQAKGFQLLDQGNQDGDLRNDHQPQEENIKEILAPEIGFGKSVPGQGIYEDHSQLPPIGRSSGCFGNIPKSEIFPDIGHDLEMDLLWNQGNAGQHFLVTLQRRRDHPQKWINGDEEVKQGQVGECCRGIFSEFF